MLRIFGKTFITSQSVLPSKLILAKNTVIKLIVTEQFLVINTVYVHVALTFYSALQQLDPSILTLNA